MTEFELRENIKKYDLDYSVPGSLSELLKHISAANGCGSQGGFKFPSTMYALNIKAACYIHDIEWKLSKSYLDLKIANKNFETNLIKIINLESKNIFIRLLRRGRILIYAYSVKLIGTPAYAKIRGFK